MNQKKRLWLGAFCSLVLIGCGGREVSSSVHPSVSEQSSATESLTPSSETSQSGEAPSYHTVNEVLEDLKGSPFQTDRITQETIGLETVTAVGVHEEQFYHQELYPVPEEATEYLAEDYGITFDGINNSGNLSILIRQIGSVSGNKVIRFRSGTYVFSNSISAESVEDLYLVGEEGTRFEFTGWGTYFEAKLSKNIHLNSIVFDMRYSPTISGTIIAVDETAEPVVTLSVPEEFTLTNSLYTSWTGETGSYMECYYDDQTGKYVPDRNANLFYNSPSSEAYKGIAGATYDSATRELKITLKRSFPFCSYKTPALGTKVSFAFTMYENAGFHYVGCEDVYMEHVTAHVVGGMGFRAEGGKNVFLNRVNFATEDTSERIMTCTADIIHTMAVEGSVEITNCLLEGSHDDALNIKSFYTQITSINQAAREIAIAQTQSEINITYAAGDVIDIYDPSSMRYVASYTIESLQKNGTGYLLTLDQRPDRGILGYNCGNATKATKLKLSNCIIRNKRNRGILLQARDSEITNCTFQNVVMGAVQLPAVMDSFREAIAPRRIRIANNKFLNNYDDIAVFSYGEEGPSSAVAGTITDVEISNNYFYNGSGSAVSLRGAGNCVISHNLYHYTQENIRYVFQVVRCSNVTIGENVLYALSESAIEFLAQSESTSVSCQSNEKKGLAE